MDSISYLIQSSLVEGGLFSEAVLHNRSVCAFHSKSAQRDTYDSMGRCFELGNYLNALELQAFGTRCKR